VKLHLVGYDLQADKDYSALREKLTGGISWWHHLESTWLVTTEQDAEAFEADLSTCLQPDDKLLVIDVTGCVARWTGFDAEASEWIKSSP
jgi:hypothetical protein